MNRPFICTACSQKFQSWQNWHEHRAVIRVCEMAGHEEHTRRCVSLREWALSVLAEVQGIEEDALSSSGQEDVHSSASQSRQNERETVWAHSGVAI